MGSRSDHLLCIWQGKLFDVEKIVNIASFFRCDVLEKGKETCHEMKSMCLKLIIIWEGGEICNIHVILIIFYENYNHIFLVWNLFETVLYYKNFTMKSYMDPYLML